MFLIADSGGTKTDWCLVDGLEEVKRVKTPGFNAMTTPNEVIEANLYAEVLPNFPEREDIERLYFYGAGCLGSVADKVKNILEDCFPNATVFVNSDMLGAARALCGSRQGIACILGTGSNTCLYDGTEIIDNVPALGYILGDEGGGAVLGKLLVSDVFKKQLPRFLCEKFQERFNISKDELIHKVYREPNANRYLASFTPFLLENIEEPAIHRLVLNNFKQFFIRNITLYPDFHNLRINVTGSVGWYFRDVLKEAAESMDCTLEKISISPMEGLVEYHCRTSS